MHIEESSPARLRVTLASSFEELNEIVDLGEAFVAKHTSDEDFAYKVVLLTTEAVTNAIEHGNALDETKQVHVEMSCEAGLISVAVQDEGAGFDPNAIKNPLKEENLLAEGGRGVFLIEEMADRVTYEDEGRRITMFFDMPTA